MAIITPSQRSKCFAEILDNFPTWYDYDAEPAHRRGGSELIQTWLNFDPEQAVPGPVGL
jgi:hypothetical protein